MIANVRPRRVWSAIEAEDILIIPLVCTPFKANSTPRGVNDKTRHNNLKVTGAIANSDVYQ